MTGGHALGWVGLAAGVAWAAVELRAQVEERRVLAETLRGIVTDGRIDSLSVEFTLPVGSATVILPTGVRSWTQVRSVGANSEAVLNLLLSFLL